MIENMTINPIQERLWQINSNGKNINAIDKIIKELSYRDFKAAHEKFWKHHKKHYDRKGNPIRFPEYSLSQQTIEALEVKVSYLEGKITEEEYKRWCLKWNLLNR